MFGVLRALLRVESPATLLYPSEPFLPLSLSDR